MIYTGSYENCKGADSVSISGDKGSRAGFIGDAYPKLAPKLYFWQVWHENLGKIPKLENDGYYVAEYIRVLSKLNAKEVMEDLDGRVLLCYEPESDFCHRHIVAAWLESELGIEVPEVRFENGQMIKLKQNEYVRKLYEIYKKEERELGKKKEGDINAKIR